MFEQLDDPKLAGRKSWKERLSEGAVILVVVVVVIGVLVYRLALPMRAGPSPATESLRAKYTPKINTSQVMGRSSTMRPSIDSAGFLLFTSIFQNPSFNQRQNDTLLIFAVEHPNDF